MEIFFTIFKIFLKKYHSLDLVDKKQFQASCIIKNFSFKMKPLNLNIITGFKVVFLELSPQRNPVNGKNLCRKSLVITRF